MARALELGIIDEVAATPAEAHARRRPGADCRAGGANRRRSWRRCCRTWSRAPSSPTPAAPRPTSCAARAALGEKCAQFVPGHPIAGRETNGPDAAIVDLYRGKKMVLTPLPENAPADVAAWPPPGRLRRDHPSPHARKNTTRCSLRSPTCRICWPTRWWTTSPTSRMPTSVPVCRQRLSRLHPHCRLVAGNVARHHAGQPGGAARRTRRAIWHN